MHSFTQSFLRSVAVVAICLVSAARLAAQVESPTAATEAAQSADQKFFQESVLPILQQHCFKCHSHATKVPKGGLVLDSRSGWATGGDTGPAIVPGKPDESLLIKAVRYGDLKMPPAGKLPPDAISILERWVAAGAVDPRTDAQAKGPTNVDIAAGRKHWAFQPVGTPAVPKLKDESWPRNDIDRFLAARLEEHHLRPAPDADRYTWLRRVNVDLTGLPPTTQQIAAFIQDNSPQAEERVVDRLLASRAFGERWGRHWLDLVGFADQIGTANDIFAEHAWRYRDYVIAAFHEDKPFDRFIREQIAGDLLPHDSPGQRADQLIATGFLVLGDLSIVEADKAKLRIDVVDQQIDKVSRAFLAMTVACARCHDHKFDPIPQRDYYALAGIFNSTESVWKAEWGVWSWPTLVDLPETEMQQTERLVRLEWHRHRLDGLKEERNRLNERKSEIDATLKSTTASADGKPEDPTRAALAKVQQSYGERLRILDTEIQHAEFFAPAPPKAFAVHDVKAPGDMQITIRGNAYALGDKVARGFLQVAASNPTPVLPAGESGRRQLADWIASRENPLTARVVVNRIWSKLFGAGIVRSVDYFGLPGERPTHPELLDYLAQRFMADGWSQRQLIRLMVLSHAYRMSCQNDSEVIAVDPDNRLFSRMNAQRLDAEAIRDSLLAVSGRLIETKGGPALPLEFPENTGNLAKGNVNPPSFRLGKFRPEQQFERTVYLPVIRSAPQAGPGELRNIFDFTQPAEFAGQRAVTAVPTQALFLMNSKLMKDRAHDLAERVLQLGADETSRLDLLWLRVLNRPLNDVERTDALAFLRDLKEATEMQRWTELCHSLLASNEFLMRL